MKKLFSTFLLCTASVLFFSVFAFSEQLISYFKIGFVPVEDKIMLKWKSVDESRISEYIIERSIDSIAFNVIGSERPRGNYFEYKFIDSNVFKTAARTFYYRLRIQLKDGSFVYTDVVHLSPRISSVKQTWGSIKAIFH